jgi:hypothetical protein
MQGIGEGDDPDAFQVKTGISSHYHVSIFMITFITVTTFVLGL